MQVREQVSGALYDYEDVPATSPAKWIAEHAPEGAKIGYDAWLHGIGWAEEAEQYFAKKGIELVAVDGNPIDAIWADRPEASLAAAVPHDDAHAGRSSADKRAEVADWLKEEGYDATVVSALDSVAWLLNMRGSDVDNTPVALSYVLAHADGTAELFIAPDKVTPELTQHFGNAVTVRDRADFVPALEAMKGKTVAVDPNHAVAGIFHALETGGAKIVRTDDPTVLPKAIKNAAEQQGHRDAQARDGAAVARFLRWLGIEAPKGGIDELTAAAKLREFREAGGQLKDASFDTISAAGHAALPHCRSMRTATSRSRHRRSISSIRAASISTGRPISPAPCGSVRASRPPKWSSATRACSRGTSSSTMQKFPTAPAAARSMRWRDAPVDGGSITAGTGHGVGTSLRARGPQRISSRRRLGHRDPLREGMILSNEPGYYKPGEYGIRIENLVLVVDAGSRAAKASISVSRRSPSSRSIARWSTRRC